MRLPNVPKSNTKISLGMALAHAETISMLDKLQMPYCIPSTTSLLAQASLSLDSRRLQKQLVQGIKSNQECLVKALEEPSMTDLGIGALLGAGEANFILLPILNQVSKVPDQGRAEKAAQRLQEDHSIAIRFVGMMTHCQGCLRITIGTEQENVELVEGLRKVLPVV